MVAVLLSFMACENELQVQQSYGFSLETMPVQKRISVGETVEIRCTLVREGRYDGARYTIRYFQPDGRGELRTDDGTVFLPNDRYPLDREVFRLYYTSRSDDQQTIDVYVEDNTGQVVKTSFTFQSENAASGLRNNVCICKPLTDSAAPASRATWQYLRWRTERSSADGS